MQLHRNSQKRLYFDKSIYFITTNTELRYPFFNEAIFCEVFVDVLLLCRQLKGFELLAYMINPDHAHLLIQPGSVNYSEIMRCLKTNVSRNINKLLCDNTIPMNTQSRDRAFMSTHHVMFFNKYGKHHRFPRFKWQKSFHDHFIRDDIDLINHVSYIKNQWIKHGLGENKWCYIAPSFNYD